jgi:pyruvate/2-oxoglutarate dehydrogenase complex dihydrolipoamide dehydrogenase (E3) component
MVERYDFVIIGAGAAGEAAAYRALARGRRTAIIERELIGGSCAFWACMPSKSLLHDARIHSLGGRRPWSEAAARRDYMINRQDRDVPDDTGHLARLTEAGAEVIRGSGRITGPGSVAVSSGGGVGDGGRRQLQAEHVVIAVGTEPTVPPVEGLERIAAWTNRQATSARELPRSMLILGGGPTGLELAQVYARFGVPVTLVHPRDRLNDRDHPRNSAAVERTLSGEGVTLRKGVRAGRILAADSADRPHSVRLSDGTSVEAHEIVLAVGRTVPVEGLGLESAGVTLRDGKLPGDGELRLADGLWVAGDPAGPEMHTHLAHYQGEMVVRMALGDDVTPDYRAIPRAVYTDPPVAGVGMTLDEARKAGHDADELTQDLATTAPGYIAESEGHVTIVVERLSGQLLGAFICGPGAGEAIHEAVLAIKTRTPIGVLADTLHAFPTVARVMGGLFAQAAEERTT